MIKRKKKNITKFTKNIQNNHLYIIYNNIVLL